MLTKEDLQAISELINGAVSASEERMIAQIAASENRVVVLSGLFCRVMIYFNYTVTVIGADIAWLYALKSILSAFQRNSLTAVLPKKQKLNKFYMQRVLIFPN